MASTTEAWEQIEQWNVNNQVQVGGKGIETMPSVIRDQLGRLFKHLQDGAGTELKFISWGETELQNGHVLQAGPTEVYAMYAFNSTGTASYIKLYDDGTNDSNNGDARYAAITNPGTGDRSVFMQMFPSIRFVDGLVVTGHTSLAGSADANHIRGFVIVGA